MFCELFHFCPDGIVDNPLTFSKLPHFNHCSCSTERLRLRGWWPHLREKKGFDNTITSCVQTSNHFIESFPKYKFPCCALSQQHAPNNAGVNPNTNLQFSTCESIPAFHLQPDAWVFKTAPVNYPEFIARAGGSILWNTQFRRFIKTLLSMENSCL